MGRRGERPRLGLAWLVAWPLSAAFAALVFLAAEELRQPTRKAPTPPPAEIGGPQWSVGFPSRIAAVDADIRKLPFRLPTPVEEERGSGPLRWTHRSYDVELARGEQPQTEAAVEAVRSVDPGLAVTIQSRADASEVRFGLDGLLVSTLRIRWLEQVTPRVEPRVVLVIGPLGDDLSRARKVVDVGAPLVLGVRPARPFSREIVELARIFGREVLVQPAVSSTGSRGTGPGFDLDTALASLPQAVGLAWADGTGEQPDRHLLDELGRRHLLLVDTGKSGSNQPQQLPPATIVTAATAETADEELHRVLDRARSEGRAIAIGPPSDDMLAAVVRALPEWRAAEVAIVPITALIPAPNLSAQ